MASNGVSQIRHFSMHHITYISNVSLICICLKHIDNATKSSTSQVTQSENYWSVCLYVSDDPATLSEDIPEVSASSREVTWMDQSQSNCSDLSFGKVNFIFTCFWLWSFWTPDLFSISINVSDFLQTLVLNVLRVRSDHLLHQRRLTEVIMWLRTKVTATVVKILPRIFALTRKYHPA